MKSPRPQDARRYLKAIWKRVAVYSCADGTVKLEPVWNGRPGMFTRMHSADMVALVLGLPEKRINWKQRQRDAAEESRKEMK
jgi:hypothetical protein